MPAAKLRPVAPSTTTVPPVMYSQQWSPTPSTTVAAPELRTAKRSPARPRKNALPRVCVCAPAERDLAPGREPPAEPLPRRAFEVDRDRALRQTIGAAGSRD